MVYQRQQLRHPRKLTISGNELVFIAMGVFSSFSRHKLFKDKFTWKSQLILFLDYERPKSEPNSCAVPTWRNVIDITSNRSRQLPWMCGLCMKQRHCVTHAVQRGKTETYGPKFLFLASIYRFVCGYILCIVHKWNYRYGATRWVVKHSGRVSGFLTRRIWKWDAKTKTGNIRPVIKLTCL
jgi:hypothetical protein